MNRTFALESKIRRHPDALWRTFEREVAVILPSASAVRTLNEVGGRVWELADGRTLAEILEILLNEYQVERTRLEVDVRTLLEQLSARGLLDEASQ